MQIPVEMVVDCTTGEVRTEAMTPDAAAAHQAQVETHRQAELERDGQRRAAEGVLRAAAASDPAMAALATLLGIAL